MLDFEALIEGNPMVDRRQLQELQEAMTKLREAGISPPTYGIDSPYERGPVAHPKPTVEDDPR